MLQLAAPPPSVLPDFADPTAQPGEPPGDAALMALSLFTVWAVRTGRTLRPVPVRQLTAEELETFWDDHLPGAVQPRPFPSPPVP